MKGIALPDSSSPARDKIRLAALERPAQRALRRAGLLAILAGALWPLQAATIAFLVSHWVNGTVAPAIALIAAAIFTLIGGLRALLDHRAGAIAFNAADLILGHERARLITRESLRAGTSGGPASAALAAMIAQKLPMLSPYLTRYRPAAVRVVALPALLIVITACISWAAALILIMTGPLIPVFMALVGIAAKEASARQLSEIGDMNTLLMDRLGALLDIRLLDAGERTARDFTARAEGLQTRTLAVLRIAFLSSSVLELFAALGVAMMAVYVGFSLLGSLHFGTWNGPLTLAQGIFLLLLAPDYFQPLRDLAAAWHDRAAAMAVAGELAVLEATPVAQVLGQGIASAPLTGAPIIETSGITVTRAGRPLHLPDLYVGAGERLAITGPSGAGKSTLLAVLAGLEPVSAGEVRVSGTPLTAENADAWRARLAWAAQSPHFLDATLAQNLDLRETGTDLAPALAAAQTEGVVATLPGGLQAKLGETGGGISGGEARRLMLARAYAGAPEVLLADEPTADLDAETAQAVTDGLMAMAARGITLIVATHDPRLIATLGRELRLGAGI